MTRIIAGVARGRRLSVPATGTRPTSDRVREAMFSSWQSALGGIVGTRIADFYAGSGAVGLEALSRGAAHALMVEKDRKAAEIVKANIATVGLPGAQVRVEDVERVVQSTPAEPYDVIFMDPPYEVDGLVLAQVLVDLVEHGWLSPASTVVIERANRDATLVWPDGFEVAEVRKYGDTALVTGVWYGLDT